MRTLLIVSLLLCSAVSFAQKKKSSSFIKDRPLPVKMVNDFSNLLTKAQRAQLEKDLVAYHKKNGAASITIITIPTLTDRKTGKEYTIDETIESYFTKWNIDSNGVLLMVLRQDPVQVTIKRGSNINSLLTYNECMRILNGDIMPDFNQELYFSGLKDGVSAMELAIDHATAAKKQEQEALALQQYQSQSAPAPAANQKEEKQLTPFEIIIGCLFWTIVIWWFINKKRIKRRRAAAAEAAYDSSNDNNPLRPGKEKNWFNTGSSDIAWLTKKGTASSTVNDDD